MVESSECRMPHGNFRAVSLEAQRVLEEEGRRRKRKSFGQLWALVLGFLLVNGSIVYGAVQSSHWREAVLSLPDVPIAGLSASRSTITGILDSESLTASYYWTFVVHNSTDNSQEAQMKLELPRNATVSRATLWVNGVPEEGAFNSTQRVERAYTWITRRHRDPLLVTQTGPQTISLKASPVLPHGDMEFRLGITAAGFLENGKVKFAMPKVLTANMDVSCAQNVHMEANDLAMSNSPQIETVVSGSLSAKHELQASSRPSLSRGNINMDGLGALSFTVERPSADIIFATRATHSNAGSYILAKVVPVSRRRSQLVCMKTNTLPAHAKVLKSEDQAFRLSTLWAFGQVEQLAEHHNETLAGQLATAYRVVSCVSGVTVMENESDYQYQELTRDPYQVLSFMPDSYVVPAASTNFSYPEASAEIAAADASWPRHDEPFDGLLSAIGYTAKCALQTTLSQSFSTVVGQLNSLNSYAATSSGGYGFASAASDSGDKSAQSTSIVNAFTTNNIALQRVMDKMQAQNKLLHDAIYCAGTVSGAIGCGISSQILKQASGSSLGSMLFGSQEKLTESIIKLNLIALLVIINFMGAFALAGRACKQSAAGEVDQCNGTVAQAIAWFMLALFLPDLSIFASLWFVTVQLLKRYEQPQIQADII
ncbi:MAG TPA: VIT domain-containing protein [Candidatus Obscuribacterales bacterium]